MPAGVPVAQVARDLADDHLYRPQAPRRGGDALVAAVALADAHPAVDGPRRILRYQRDRPGTLNGQTPAMRLASYLSTTC